jgi:hypothetical protein
VHKWKTTIPTKAQPVIHKLFLWRRHLRANKWIAKSLREGAGAQGEDSDPHKSSASDSQVFLWRRQMRANKWIAKSFREGSGALAQDNNPHENWEMIHKLFCQGGT